MAARSGSGGEKKPSRIPVTGLNLVEALADAGVFIASQGFVGAVRMLLQGTLTDAARAIFARPDEPYKADDFDKILGIVRKHVADVYPAPDRPKVERAVESYLLKAVDLYGNGSLSPEARRLAIETLKNSLGQDLRSIQDSHTTFQTRVFDMLEAGVKSDAMRMLGSLTAEERTRWSKISEQIESPDVFAAAITAHGSANPSDVTWRNAVLTSLEVMVAKPEQPKGKNLLEQLADLRDAQAITKLFVSRKRLPKREEKIDLSLDPSLGFRRPETDEEYKKRLVTGGFMKADEDLRDIVREDAKAIAKEQTLSRVDAEDDALTRLVRGEYIR